MLFLLCISLAFAFWILNILNKTYVYEMDASLSFQHLPEGKALVLDRDNKLSITVQGTGWNFLRSRLKLLSDTLLIDLRKYEEKDEIDLGTSVLAFEQQWNNRLKIVQLYPSKIMLNVAQKRVRKVPVKLNLQLNLEPTYDVVDEIHHYPDSVFISGSEEEINSIKYVETKSISTHPLNKQEVLYIPLNFEKYRNVVMSTSVIKVEIPIEQFTEKTIQLPVSSKWIFTGYSLQTIPSTCKVTYSVALSKYDEITSQSFRVLAEPSHNLNNQLRLTLKVRPKFVKNIKIEPELVEYVWIRK